MGRFVCPTFMNSEGNNMKKKLHIKDANKYIRFNNRKVRTPVILEVTDRDLRNLKPVLKMYDIKDIEIIDPNKENKKDEAPDLIPETKEVVIEELDEIIASDDPKSILEKLMDGEIE